MAPVVLKATRRSVVGKQVKALRREGKLIGVMYGHNFEPINIVMDLHETSLALAGLSSSTIINIDVDGEQHAALVREKQVNYVKNSLLHVDFQVVSLTEKIRSAVSITLTGTSPAVRDLNAVLVHNLSQVEVEALPRDLPEHLTADISGLATVGAAFYVRDLAVPQGVVILTPGDEIIAVATGAAKEEEAAEGAGEAAEPEVIERGKKEEEE